MARTDYNAVTAAIDTSLAKYQVEAFIEDANVWVTARLAGEGLSEAVLTAIEKYLACHFVTLRDPRHKEAKFGDTSEKFQRDDKVTEYLKAAIALDPTGIIDEAFDPSDDSFPFRAAVGTGYADA
jgi:hypothetical protein